jgi:hypothetical protein
MARATRRRKKTHHFLGMILRRAGFSLSSFDFFNFEKSQKKIG